MELDAQDTSEKKRVEGLPSEDTAEASVAPASSDIVNGTWSVQTTIPNGDADTFEMSCAVDIYSDWPKTKKVVQALMSEMLDECVKEHEAELRQGRSMNVVVGEQPHNEDKGCKSETSDLEEVKVKDSADTTEGKSEGNNVTLTADVTADEVCTDTANKICKEAPNPPIKYANLEDNKDNPQPTDSESHTKASKSNEDNDRDPPNSSVPTSSHHADNEPSEHYNELEQLFLGLPETINCDQAMSTATDKSTTSQNQKVITGDVQDKSSAVQKFEEATMQNTDATITVPVNEDLLTPNDELGNPEPTTVPNSKTAIVPNNQLSPMQEDASGARQKDVKELANVVENETEDGVVLLVEFDAEEGIVSIDSSTPVHK